jgi:hypothetical protein
MQENERHRQAFEAYYETGNKSEVARRLSFSLKKLQVGKQSTIKCKRLDQEHFLEIILILSISGPEA